MSLFLITDIIFVRFQEMSVERPSFVRIIVQPGVYIYIYTYLHSSIRKSGYPISLLTSTFYWNFSFIIYRLCYIVKIGYKDIILALHLLNN